MPTVVEFGRRLRAGQVTAEQCLRDCLAHVGAHADLNAFISVMGEAALVQARALDRELSAGHDRGPLHGVPISVKDLIDIAGWPTTAASHVRDGHMATADAPIITTLTKAGAIVVGKTNLHEFAFGTTNEESGFGPAHNPHDPSRSPGGSSGGSAVSVAAGMALASIGTDTGGSIRIPSAACGIVGLKPRHGDVSTETVIPLSRTLDHVGPLTQTVVDARLLYHALLGRPAAHEAVPVRMGDLRLAVLRPYFCEMLDDDVRSRFEEALDRYRRAGARVVDVDIPHAAVTGSIYQHIVLSEAAAYHGATLETMPERYTAPVRVRLEMGRYILAEDYIRALDGREVLRKEVDTALDGHDALLLPTLPIPAPPLGATVVTVGGKDEPIRSVMLRLTQLFNLTGHPAIALPSGLTSSGLPCSIQLVGTTTDRLIDVAEACESQLSA